MKAGPLLDDDIARKYNTGLDFKKIRMEAVASKGERMIVK